MTWAIGKGLRAFPRSLKRLFGDPRSLSINFDLINNFGVLLINFKVDQLPRPWFFFLYCKNAQKAFISFFLLSTGMCWTWTSRRSSSRSRRRCEWPGGTRGWRFESRSRRRPTTSSSGKTWPTTSGFRMSTSTASRWVASPVFSSFAWQSSLHFLNTSYLSNFLDCRRKNNGCNGEQWL